MFECAWMCLCKLDYEYASGPKYAEILNMIKFWIWKGSQYANVTQHSEHARICLGKVLNISYVLNMPQFLNMTGFWICRVRNMPQYDWICLNTT